jgi:hypothetical protein
MVGLFWDSLSASAPFAKEILVLGGLGTSKAEVFRVLIVSYFSDYVW